MPKYLIFFYKSSFGEIFAGLPFITKILDKNPNIKALFFYTNNEQISSIPLSYKKIIDKYFKLVKLNNKNFLLFFLKYIFTRNLIITCDNGHSLQSSIFSFYSFRSSVLFFHHAYTIPNLKFNHTEQEIKKYKNLYNGYHHNSFFCAHSKLEIEYRKKQNFINENIFLAGNIGYSLKWMNDITQNSNLGSFLKTKKEYFDKIIFIPTRGKHPLYLSEKNSIYLLNSIKEIIKKFPNYLFLLKMHPRQNDIDKFKKIETENKNCLLINYDTTSISKESDLVISYCSSAITDALSTNTPVVEFYRHDKYHSQLREKDSELVSLYYYYNLCPSYQNKEEVIELLHHPEKWKQIKQQQQITFKKIFTEENPYFSNDLIKRLEKNPFKYKYFLYLFIFPSKIIIYLITRSIKKLSIKLKQ